MSGVTITTGQRHRAAIHAALAEPARLAIVDMLALRDASPKELAAEFSMTTNLLAHHLAVLEGAGIIHRRRSQGDGRRTYVQLRHADPFVAALVGPPGRITKPRRVVFVCTHNSARSQLAAAAWERASTVPVASCGTHPAAKVHRRAVATARRHRLSLQSQGTAHIDDVIHKGDLLIAVCDQAHEELARGANRDALHWSVADPVPVNTDAAFERALQDISSRVNRLAASLDQRK